MKTEQIKDQNMEKINAGATTYTASSADSQNGTTVITSNLINDETLNNFSAGSYVATNETMKSSSKYISTDAMEQIAAGNAATPYHLKNSNTTVTTISDDLLDNFSNGATGTVSTSYTYSTATVPASERAITDDYLNNITGGAYYYNGKSIDGSAAYLSYNTKTLYSDITVSDLTY